MPAFEFHMGKVHNIANNPEKKNVIGICPICGLGDDKLINYFKFECHFLLQLHGITDFFLIFSLHFSALL